MNASDFSKTGGFGPQSNKHHDDELFSLMLKGEDSAQQTSVEHLRAEYLAGISSGPSIEITVEELLMRFKADLNEKAKI